MHLRNATGALIRFDQKSQSVLSKNATALKQFMKKKGDAHIGIALLDMRLNVFSKKEVFSAALQHHLFVAEELPHLKDSKQYVNQLLPHEVLVHLGSQNILR